MPNTLSAKALLTWDNITGVLFVFLSVQILTWYSGRQLDACGIFLLVYCASRGVLNLLRGLLHRVGDELYCAKCGYQRAPNGEVGSRCSECGAAWDRPHGLKRGRWRVRLSEIGKGLLLVLPLTLFLFSHTRLAVHWLPSDFLVYRVTNLTGHSYLREWEELRNRSLTAGQEDALVDNYVERRGKDLPVDSFWFSSAAQRGKLTPIHRNRYLLQSLKPCLEVPSCAYVGEPFETVVRADYRMPRLWWTSGEFVVYFGGIEVDNSSEIVGRRDVVSLAKFFGSDAAYTPRVSIVPKAEGEMSIRAHVWTVFAKWKDIPWAMPWREDGSANLPARALWYSEIEMSASIEVKQR